MQKSGLLPTVMRAAFGQREAQQRILEIRLVDRGRPCRGIALSEASWDLKATFALEAVEGLKMGEHIRKWCGLVVGYPAALEVERMKDGDTLGAFLCLSAPKCELDGAPAVGVGLRVDMMLPLDTFKSYKQFSNPKSSDWGYRDVFDKPWAEAVCEDNPYFPEDELEVQVTAKLLLKE